MGKYAVWLIGALAGSTVATAACSAPRHTATTAGGTVAAPAPPATTVLPAWKDLSYHGVSLSVPAAWPVIDGAHYPGCGFPPNPAVYLGPTYTAPSCAATSQAPAQDGVWAYPAGPQPEPGSASTTLRQGQTGYIYPGAGTSGTTSLWFHGVAISVGIGPDPAIAKRILASISWSPASPDSPVEGACPTGSDATAMPAPETVTTPMNLASDGGTLDPPAAGEHPALPASAAWKAFQGLGQTASPGETARLLFGDYSAGTPAQMNPDGSTTPLYRNRPAWLIYITPVSTSAGNCGPTIIAPFDAGTGQSFGVTVEG